MEKLRMIRLDKKHDSDFTVLNISDPQLGDEEWAEGSRNGEILRYTLRELVTREKPDLITVSGDISWASAPKAYGLFADYIETFGIPWAPVWGNHDNQDGNEIVENHLRDFSGHPHLLYERGPSEIGNGNYVIQICDGDRKPAALIMMDAHDRDPFPDGKGGTQLVWGKLWDNQMIWYREQVLDLRKNGCDESVIIAHIPVFAYRTAFDAAFSKEYAPGDIRPENSNSDEYWNEGYKDSFGVCYEGICSYPADDGVFEILKQEGHTKAFIAGHDHVNNYAVKYDGIWLVYSLKAGPGCYWNPVLNGGTVLKIGNEGIGDIRHSYVDVSSFLD